MCRLKSVIILVAPILRVVVPLRLLSVTWLRFVVPPLVSPFLGSLVPVEHFLRGPGRAVLCQLVTNGLVASSPAQRVNIGHQLKIMIPGEFSSPCKLFHDWNEAVSVKCCVVLLRQAHGSQFPIWHLLSFTNFIHKYLFCNFGKAGLLTCNTDFGVVCLCVYEIAHVLVKVHFRQMFRKNVHVRFERETNVDCFFMSE